jgi:HD-GYP domain-containing protein (c-di-GMP phosphodiesterase class II)
MAPSRALEELIVHRGSQFDPDIVDAMVALISGTKDLSRGTTD